MTLRVYIIFTFIILFLCRCSTEQPTNSKPDKTVIDTSKVKQFEYGGYGDTIYALVYGQVSELEKNASGKNTLKPLQNVDIKVLQSNKAVRTDNKGEFEIWSEKGVFSFIISKQGYEPIKLTNYVSDPDQISNTKIILVKGSETRTFEIPKWTR